MVVTCGLKFCKRNSRKDKEHSFFKIPKDPIIRKLWMQFAGREVVTDNFRLCSEHFEQNAIFKRHPRPILVKKAVPTLQQMPSEDQPMSVEEHSIAVPELPTLLPSPDACETPIHFTISPVFRTNDEDMHPSSVVLSATIAANTIPESGPMTPLTPRTMRIRTQKRTINALRSKIIRLQRLKNSRATYKTDRCAKLQKIISDSSQFLTKEAHLLFSSQLLLDQHNKYGKRYSNEVKDIALSLFYHSPKAYRFLKTLLNLPSERTLRSYQSKFPIYPGLNATVLSQLGISFQKAPVSQKIVSLLFDEINLHPEFHFDSQKDKFIGVADDGIERQSDVAKSALVAMISWANMRMKQVIGYWFFGSQGNSEKTHNSILATVDKVFEAGLIVKAIIFYQGPKNQGLIKKLNSSPEKPYFEKDGHQIFVMFDPPHLLKSLRNNLLTKKLHYKGKIVDWQEIRKVYSLSQESPLNLIPKISDKHFNLNHFSKMRVSLAAQIFSQAMYTACLVYTTLFPEKFDVTNNITSQFISDMDKLFDALNSSLKQKTVSVKLNYAITKDSEHIVFLKEMLDNFATARFERGPQPACIRGLLLTISAVIHLSDDLIKNYDFQAVCTRRFNQDPLENLFAVVRQQHGCSVNPSPLQFELGLRHILITQLSKVFSTTNCEADKNLIFVKLSQIKCIEHQSDLNYNDSMEIPDIKEINCTPTDTQIFTQENATYYICGYLAKKFLMHHKCSECKTLLLKNSESNFGEYKLFTLAKTYDEAQLLHVKINVFDVVLSWEKLYQRRIRDVIGRLDITKFMATTLKDACPVLTLCSSAASDAFLHLFLRIRCHWEARFLRRELRENKTRTTCKQTTAKMRRFV